jgi:hypothetical protein
MYQGIAGDFTAVAQAPVLAGLEVSLCTIQAPSGTLTPSGAPDGTYANVSGLVDIQCMDAPDNLGSSLSAQEQNALAEIESTARRHVLLNGYYSQLSPSTNWGDIGWRAVLTNTNTGQAQTYDIRGAESDSYQSQTRLCLRRVSV